MVPTAVFVPKLEYTLDIQFCLGVSNSILFLNLPYTTIPAFSPFSMTLVFKIYFKVNYQIIKQFLAFANIPTLVQLLIVCNLRLDFA